MGGDEMRRVREANTKSIEQNASKLTFYYGKTDKWCPYDYFVRMRSLVDEMKADCKPCPALILDENKIDHAFVVFENQCDLLANLISDKI